MHFTTLFSLPALAALSSTLVSAQDAYGQAQCVTSVIQTSTACCGPLAGSTTTSLIDCHGCAPVYEPTVLCECFAPPVTDEALTSTAKACSPTATPTMTTKVALPTAVASYCEGKSFIAIFPPSAAQRCCEGELAACDGLVPGYPTDPAPAIPTECSYTRCAAESQCSRCCAGDLRACDGIFPPPGSDLPSDGPAV